MPGLVKVGYSLKDPSLRARELDNTGAPHSYVVDYEALLEEPRQVEKRAHTALRDVREGREWFRCSVEDAIVAIRAGMIGTAIQENFVHADRARALALGEKQRRESEAREAALQRLAAAQDKLRKDIDAILRRDYPEPALTPYWTGWSIAALVVIGYFAPRGLELGAFILAAMAGALAAWGHTSMVRDRQVNSAGYREAIRKRDEALEHMRLRVEG